jgi:hypothetical protein
LTNKLNESSAESLDATHKENEEIKQVLNQT